MNKKSLQLWLSIITVALAIGTLYLLFTTLEAMNSNIAPKKELLEREKKSTSSIGVQQSSVKEASRSETTLNEPSIYNNADSLIVTNWLTRSGRYTDDQLADYQSYSDKELIELANKGDLKAMHLLSDRLLSKADKKGAAHYTELAAIHGSLSAIEELAIYVPSIDKNGNPETVHENILASLTFYKALEVRGDRLRSDSAVKSLSYTYEHTFDKKLQLSDDDIAKVEKMSAELIGKWEARRGELGLGKFDNSVDPAVDRYMDMILSKNP